MEVAFAIYEYVLFILNILNHLNVVFLVKQIIGPIQILRHTIQMTNDRPVVILPLDNKCIQHNLIVNYEILN